MPGRLADAGGRRGEERSARARRLAAEHPAAAELLTFYAALADYQAKLAVRASSAPPASLPFSTALPVDLMVTAIPGFLDWLEQTAPAMLAAAAHAMRGVATEEWRRLVDVRTADQDDLDDPTAFVVEAIVQPFAEAIASARHGQIDPVTAEGSGHPPRCPVCSARPIVGVLHEEGHGARRALVCGRCLSEWTYLRVLCPACGEQRFDALPVFTADVFGHVRIEACDSCHTYLKTIDLTKDGHAVPVVDDIASVSLDLWARDRGYARLRPNLLRS